MDLSFNHEDVSLEGSRPFLRGSDIFDFLALGDGHPKLSK